MAPPAEVVLEHPPAAYMPLPGLRTISCALVRCGTSRAVIVDGRTLPTRESREQILWTLIAGDTPGDGLGGEHYQFNKIAEVFPGSDASHFEFRFYQADLRERRLIENLECANVAAGAALFATTVGLAAVDEAGVLWARNLGTNQLIELASVSRDSRVSGDWRVRFLVDAHGPAVKLHTPDPLPLVHPDGRSMEFWVAERGNVFVLANATPEAAEPEMIEQLRMQGTCCATMAGIAPHRAEAPKVILYSVEAPDLSPPVVRAVCYFNGERHHSLPGSAAMCLSSFLAETRLLARGGAHGDGELLLRLCHPSGTLDTRVQWEACDEGWKIVATEFTTGVRMLFWGSAPLL